jgi:hypothetical protein
MKGTKVSITKQPRVRKNDALLKEEILAILRAADEIIATGGRTLLTKILKGSKEKKLLELGLDRNPSYGKFRSLKPEEIMEKVDWMIEREFLEIQFSGKLPMIIFTDKGWAIEREQRVNEFIREWDEWLDAGVTPVSMVYLKERNRGMVMLLLHKIMESGDKQYVPFLNKWAEIAFKKVRQAINGVIRYLEHPGTARPELDAPLVDTARLLGQVSLESEWLKCWECGERFEWDVEEQKRFKLRAYVPPKRCPDCREKKWLMEMGINPDME